MPDPFIDWRFTVEVTDLGAEQIEIRVGEGEEQLVHVRCDSDRDRVRKAVLDAVEAKLDALGKEMPGA